VRWTLGPGPDSTNVLRADVLWRTVRFDATSHGLTPRLVFAVPPSNGTRGQPMVPAVRVVALDAWGQRDTTISGTVTLTVTGTGFDAAGPMSAGQVSFPAIVPTFSGSGYRMRAVKVGTTPAMSTPFDVAP
jgi:hypothetical protein